MKVGKGGSKALTQARGNCGLNQGNSRIGDEKLWDSCCGSVTKSCLTLYDLMDGLQHTRLLCPLPSPGVCSDSCPLCQWCHPTSHLLSSLSPPASVFPNIRVFSNVSTLCIRWSKYWSFSFSIIPSNEYSGLISFRIYCLISLQAKGLSRVFFNTTVWKYPIEYELKLEQVVIC